MANISSQSLQSLSGSESQSPQLSKYAVPPHSPIQSKVVQLPSSSLASGLKLQALEFVQPDLFSGSVLQLNKNISAERKSFKMVFTPF